MQELWRDVKGFQGRYQVSNYGRVKSLDRYHKKQIIRKPKTRKYAELLLTSNGKTKWVLVHRLVAQAFIPNPQNKPEVNHKDGNKLNNNVDNLQWCTRSENELHSLYTLGFYKSDKFNEIYKKSSKTLKELYKNKKHHATKTKWMNKEGTQVRVKKEDVDKMLKLGYRLGR